MIPHAFSISPFTPFSLLCWSCFDRRTRAQPCPEYPCIAWWLVHCHKELGIWGGPRRKRLITGSPPFPIWLDFLKQELACFFCPWVEAYPWKSNGFFIHSQTWEIYQVWLCNSEGLNQNPKSKITSLLAKESDGEVLHWSIFLFLRDTFDLSSYFCRLY